jgi:hypothetical protein
MIFRKYLELKNVNRVVSYLNENGYQTKEFVTKDGRKSGGNRWTSSSLYGVLTNRAYIGQREFNKTNRSLSQSDLKEDDRYFYVDAQWPALISKELFSDVQKLLIQNKKKARKYTHKYRLTGLIRCSECGQNLIGQSGTGSHGKYFYYCHNRKLMAVGDRHLRRCKIESVSAVQVEEAVIARLRQLANDRPLVEALARNLARETVARSEHQKALLSSHLQEKRRLEQKVANLLETISETDNKAIRNSLTTKLSELQDQLEKIEIVVSRLKNEDRQSGNVLDVSSAFSLLKAFKNQFEKADASIQAEILKNVVAGIEVREDGILVKIFGSNSGNPLGIRPAVSRSGVRPVFNLVEAVLSYTNQAASLHRIDTESPGSENASI